MNAMVAHLARMPLSPRVGLMVASVIFTLVEAMDVLQLFISPDDSAMIRQLADFPAIRQRALALITETQERYSFMRVNTVVLAVLAGFVAARFAGRMARSLAALRDAAANVANGDLDTTVTMKGSREVRTLAHSIDQMRIGLGRVVTLARENAALRKDVALGEAASVLFTPNGRAQGDLTNGLSGFIAIRGDRTGFWWHHAAKDEQVHIVLGCTKGSGPAAVMSLAALAGAVRDELLHTEALEPRELVVRAEALVSSLTKRSVGLAIVTIDHARGKAHFVRAGACKLDFAFHEALTANEIEDSVEAGSLRFTERLALMLGPANNEQLGRATLEQTLLSEAAARAATMGELMQRPEMPAAVVIVERGQVQKRHAA